MLLCLHQLQPVLFRDVTINCATMRRLLYSRRVSGGYPYPCQCSCSSYCSPARCRCEEGSKKQRLCSTCRQAGRQANRQAGSSVHLQGGLALSH
jgi:hypothetical protein